MAAPLLLIVGGVVVLGGVAAAVASSSSSSSSSGDGDVRIWLRTPLLKVTPPAKALPAGSDKFQDPIYECFGTGPASALPYRWRLWSPLSGAEAKIGFEYLTNVPVTAATRVAALRARIGPRQPARVKFPKTDLGGIAESSYKQLQDVAISLRNAYGTASNYGEIAAKFGLPVDTVKQQAQQITKFASEYVEQSEFIAAAVKYAPLAKSFLTSFAQFAANGGKVNQAAAIELVGTTLATVVAGVVPLVGPMISSASSMAAAYVRERESYREQACKDARDKILATASATMAEGFPPLWHLFDDYGSFCNVENKMDTAKRNAMGDVAEGSYMMFRKLSPNDKAHVVRWWSTAVAMMSHPDVYQAFDKLGRGGAFFDKDHTVPLSGDGRDKGRASERSNGAIYGGVLATDEQVMLVAAPVAVAAGIDVDDFARRLYERCGGWRTADASSFVYAPKGFRIFKGVTWDSDAGTAVYDYRCEGIVANAWWLQWAALARDAFKLADEMIAARK